MAFQVITKNHLDTLMAQRLLCFFKISFAPLASVFSHNLSSYFKGLKALPSLLLALKLVASSLE